MTEQDKQDYVREEMAWEAEQERKDFEKKEEMPEEIRSFGKLGNSKLVMNWIMTGNIRGGYKPRGEANQF